MRRDAERLQDILDAIDAIRSRVGADRAAFDGDAMVRVWCLHHVTVIGEAATGLSEQFKARHQHTPWRKITGMRNAVVHGYFNVDWDIVWAVVERELEPLRAAVKAMLDAEADDA
jgi:uncharacterized protein with HEPN domain